MKKVGQVASCICVLSHSIPGTNDGESAQIIIPQKELKRKYDVYISCVSYAHHVGPKGRWIALMSTNVETANPQAELEPALKLLGKIDDRYSQLPHTHHICLSGKIPDFFLPLPVSVFGF